MPESTALARVRRQIARARFPRLLGLKLTRLARGKVEVRMPNRADFRQYRGATHGGALSALVDTAATMASNTLIKAEEDTVTIELKVNFLAAGAGRHLDAKAEVLHHGRTTSITKVEIRRDDGRLCAYATVTNLIYAIKG
jgi:uncharacterized protein (TIGR00369 family)